MACQRTFASFVVRVRIVGERLLESCCRAAPCGVQRQCSAHAVQYYARRSAAHCASRQSARSAVVAESSATVATVAVADARQHAWRRLCAVVPTRTDSLSRSTWRVDFVCCFGRHLFARLRQCLGGRQRTASFVARRALERHSVALFGSTCARQRVVGAQTCSFALCHGTTSTVANRTDANASKSKYRDGWRKRCQIRRKCQLDDVWSNVSKNKSQNNCESKSKTLIYLFF